MSTKNPKKSGWYMPDGKLEIVTPKFFEQDNPDYVLILAWNFANEIMADQHAYADRGGQFIVPIPHPEIVTGKVIRGAL